MKKKPRRSKRKRSSQEQNIRKGKLLERITASLFRTPGVTIRKNVDYPTTDGESTRELDILLKTNVAGLLPVEYAFQCKNEKRRIGVGKISQFIGDLKDVGIPSKYGIFVSVNGFTSGAIRLAKKEGIRTLVLKGLSGDRLKSEISAAIQHNIFLIPIIENITVMNDISKAEYDYQFFIFSDGDKRPTGTIIDLLFNKWINGEIPNGLGKQLVEMQVPENWFQFYRGEPISPMKISAELSVIAVTITVDGVAEKHLLLDAQTEKIEKFNTQVNFPKPKAGEVIPLTHFTSEDELEAFVEKPGNTQLTIRTRLPRIISNRSYYPFSQVVADKVFTQFAKFDDDFKGVNQKKIDELLFEASKNDIFREGKYNLLGRIVSVIIVDDDGELIDLTLASEQGDFDKVISLKEKYFENPSNSFRKILARAYEEKSRQLFGKANQQKPLNKNFLEKGFINIRYSLELEPKCLSALELKANFLFARGHYDKALRTIDSILSTDPNNVELHAYRVQILLKLEHWSIALKGLDRLKKLSNGSDNSEFNDAYIPFCKAKALFGLGKYKQSWKILIDLWLSFPGETVKFAAEESFVDQIGKEVPTIEGRWFYIEVLHLRSVELLSMNEFEIAEGLADYAFELLEGIKLLYQMTEKPIAVGEMKGKLIEAVLKRIVISLRNRANEIFAQKQIDRITSWFKLTYNQEPTFLSDL